MAPHKGLVKQNNATPNSGTLEVTNRKPGRVFCALSLNSVQKG